MSAPLAQSTSIMAPFHSLLRVAMGLSLMLCLGCLSGDGGGSDSDLTTPMAQFSQSGTTGTPGTVVTFADNSTGTIEGREWDFGPLGKRTEANPVITFADPGIYSVRLTVRGPRGESVMVRENLIEIAAIPNAGFECSTLRGFAPLTVTCTDGSADAAEIAWDFGDGGGSNDRNPTYIFDTPGNFVIEQIATSAGGTDTQQVTVEVIPLEIVASVTGGSAPLDVSFTANVGSASGIAAWTINGESDSGRTIQYRFNTPGTFTVFLVFGDMNEPIETRLIGTQMIQYTVDYSSAVAAFAPSVPAGPGPLSVTLEDQSTGEVEEWVWEFGDGSTCTFPDPNEPGATNPVPVCNASSPTHEYAEVGSYNVNLSIRGPGANEGDAEVEDEVMVVDAIRVTALDPSFEAQTTNAELAQGWTTLRPESPSVEATHIALARSGGADAGMPTDGNKWALLDGRGTDGSEYVDLIENGIQQRIMPPAAQPVLEFDYVLLYAEPPAAGTLDAMTATISDGTNTTTLEIDSARADVSTAYAGPSARFPTEDGSTVRATAVHTASVNLTEAFPGASGPQFYTLTIRTTNAMNAFRSPRVYVDNLRFTEAADPIVGAFTVDELPVVAGFPVQFIEEICPDPSDMACLERTSWRWDFGTQMLASPPGSAASDEQNPTYTFPVAGLYEVRLLTRVGDQESLSTLTVDVLEGPVAEFEILTAAPYTAPASLEFGNLSTADPADPIAAWSWDFGGWGTSTQATPDPVNIGQAGEVTVRLTITTDSGRTNATQMTIQVD